MKKTILILLAVASLTFVVLAGFLVLKGGDLIATYRPEIEQELSKTLGATVKMEDIKLTVLPRPKIGIEKLEILDNTGATSGLSVHSVSADAELLPLFQKKIEISTVRINHPSLIVEKSSAGTSIKGLDPKPAPTPSTSSPSKANELTTKGTAIGVGIERVVISDGEVTYNDTLSNRSHSLKSIQVDASVSFLESTLKIPRGLLSCNVGAQTPVEISITQAFVGAKDARIEDLKIRAFGGEISAPTSAEITPNLIISSKISAASLSIEQILNVFKPELARQINGKIDLFKAEVSRVNTSHPLNSGSVVGSWVITNAEIKGLNIPSQALSRIDSLPFIAGSLRQGVPPEFESLFARTDTSIKEVRGTFNLTGGGITIKDLLLESDFFSISGDGLYDFNGLVNLTAKLTFNREVSSGIMARVKELQPLLDNQGRLVLQLKISGNLPVVTVTPDINDILKNISVNGVAQVLEGALKDKKIGGKIGKLLGF